MSGDEHNPAGSAPAVSEAVERRPWYRRPGPVAGTAAAGLGLALALAFGGTVPGAQLTTSTASDVTSAEAASPFAGGASGGTSGDTSGGVSGGASGGTDGSSPDGGQDGTTGPFGSPDSQAPAQSGTTGGSTSQAAATTADDEESTGVVLIDTDLEYEDASAAGTGMVLTSDGLILTNNHVIEGATDITVTVPSTGDTYTATVLGTDTADDVALLQLDDASGLSTITVDDDSETVGQSITAVGNSEGEGVLTAADGTISALEATVTTASEGVVGSETLDGMIQISASVVSGDSGGAVLDDEGEVIGMTTAASSGSGATVAYAIPIEDVLDVAEQIENGDESDGVALGYPAFLGVEVASDTSAAVSTPGSGMQAQQQSGSSVSGATIAGVIADTPAAEAGITAGDTITAVDGTKVSSATDLTTTLAGYDPGDTVTVTWTDSAGQSQSAAITLTTGPAA